ncbi:MAG: hypothetical protein R3F48_05530 [Candidatus Zixiibacteriota bacterium]
MAKILKNIVKLIGLGIIALIVLELAARTDDYINWDAPFWSIYSEDMLRVSDEYGWHNRPNAKYQKWEINSLGFRGPELATTKPDSVLRVICVGASATFGLFEEADKDYPSQLREMLNEKYPGRFEVQNAACPGMSPPRIAHYFDVWIKQFDPDIIAYYPAPDFYFNDEVPTDTIFTRPAPPLPVFESRLKGKVRIALKGFLPRGWQLAYKNWEMDKIVKSHGPGWQWQTPPPERLELYRRHLIGVINTIRGAGSTIILATKTNSISDEKNEFDRINMTNWLNLHPQCTEECLLEMDVEARKIVLDLGQEMDVPIVDIAPLLPKTNEYFGDHHHFSTKGAQIVAEGMFKEIVKIVEADSAFAAHQ